MATADPNADLTAATAATARGLGSLTRSVGKLREAVGAMGEQLDEVEHALAEHAGLSSARHEETLRRLGELSASPLARAAEQHAVQVLEGRVGVSGWLRSLPARAAQGARWAVEHPVQAGLLLSGAAGVLRILSARVPGLGVVAEALEAVMSTLAPLPPTGTGGAP
jgi:hypothetical protein